MTVIFLDLEKKQKLLEETCDQYSHFLLLEKGDLQVGIPNNITNMDKMRALAQTTTSRERFLAHYEHNLSEESLNSRTEFTRSQTKLPHTEKVSLHINGINRNSI